MKKIIVGLFLILLSFTSLVWAESERLDTDNLIKRQIETIEFSELEEIINHINKDVEEYIPSINIKKIIYDIIKGKGTINPNHIIKATLKILFKEIIASSRLLIQIIVLSVICAILRNLQSAFEGQTVGRLSYNVCYLVIISITIKSFMIALSVGGDTIDTMVNFMQALMPILLTMLMAVGSVTTSAFFSPIILGSVGFIGTLIKNLILPLLLFSAVLTIVNNLSSNIKVNKLERLLRQSAAVILGFVLTGFVGVISIQGITAATVDGVTMRTAKFAVDKFIPIIGSFLADAMDTVIGCSLLVKNAIGAMGLIFIFILCLMPMIKIVALIAIYKLSAALVEPISEDNLAGCLTNMANSLVVLFATVISVGIMFFITITIIVGTGNITTMMR